MVQQTAQLNPNGGIPELEITFGDANIGVCRIFRWDANRNPTQIRSADASSVSLGASPAELASLSISYEAIIQSPKTGPDQPYAMFLSVRQDGQPVPGGEISETGKLNPDGAKSVIGFITFHLLLILFLAFSAFGQSEVDLAIPESPALAVLGLTPAVVRPATPRDFAVSLLSGAQTAMAIDAAPYWLAAGHLVDRQIYKANPMVRLLAGTELSIASTKASQPSEPSRLAVGVLIRIFDKGDPRLDDTLAMCLEKAAERVLASSAPCRPGDDCETESARREAVLKNTCRNDARARNWNRSSWAVGGARDTQSAAVVGWCSYAYGFEGVPGLEHTSQFIFQWTRRNRDSAGGLRLRTGGPDIHISIDWTAVAGQSRIALAAERKVSENVWLEMTVGGISARRVFVETSFHWGLSTKP